ncbi:MAG: hypothetical protein HY927_02425 [Elusimicrobia bacterium]|nr:hypothetical protein [Elusimicrobiota bacterium]
MTIVIVAAVALGLSDAPARAASVDDGHWEALQVVTARGPALPGFFDGVRGLPAAPIALPGVPPVAAVPFDGLPFNGVTLPRAAFLGKTAVSPLLVTAIDATRTSLKLLLYDFSLPDVSLAIERAVARVPAVEVMVVLDQNHVFPANGRRRNPVIAKLLADRRIQARIIRGLGDFGIMHDKIGIFDGKLVETGSYNWGTSPEKSNHENAVFTDDPSRVAAYAAHWKWVWENAYAPDAPRPPIEVAPGPPADPSGGVSFQGVGFPGQVFSPNGGAARSLLAAIRLSKATIDVAMFSFTSKELAEALWERRQAGVRVRLLLDRKQARNPSSVLPFLREKGFDVLLGDGRTKAGVMHNKFTVFDGAMVETGSYNWTTNAEYYSFENAAFLVDPADVAAFQEYFDWLRGMGQAPQALASSAQDLPDDDND